MAHASPEEVEGVEWKSGVRLLRLKTAVNAQGTAQRWFAPDYGCSIAKEVMEWTRDGSKSVKTVVSARHEIDEDLFRIRTDYEHVSPSQFALARGRATPAGRAMTTDAWKAEESRIREHFRSLDDFWATHRF